MLLILTTDRQTDKEREERKRKERQTKHKETGRGFFLYKRKGWLLKEALLCFKRGRGMWERQPIVKAGERVSDASSSKSDRSGRKGTAPRRLLWQRVKVGTAEQSWGMKGRKEGGRERGV